MFILLVFSVLKIKQIIRERDWEKSKREPIGNFTEQKQNEKYQ